MARFQIFRRSKRPGNHGETVVFYPSYANWDAGRRCWVLHIQGCIFHPRVTWLSRGAVMTAVRRYMRVEKDDGRETFETRFRPFLTRILSGRNVSVRLGGRPLPLAHSTTAGLFRGTVQVSESELEDLTANGLHTEGWLNFESVPGPRQELAYGRVCLVPEQGVSIISDIDDTLKHSNVPDRRDLFRNTFLRPYTSIPGMPDLYREAATAGAMFHYVSASPWQLYEPLSKFWEQEGFPDGSFHLKLFRLRDTAKRIRGRPKRELYKRASINPILSAFRQRKFLMIGDSGEQDPQIYARLAIQNPDQIQGVFIRRVAEDSRTDADYEQLFEGLSRETWQIFDHPDEIRDRVLDLTRSAASACSEQP